MADLTLWKKIEELKANYKWVELTHELSPDTPHWHGFQPLAAKQLFDYPAAPMRVYEYTHAGQYGTHVDVPIHFVPGGRDMSEIELKEFAYPLCVIDKSEAAKKDPDYAITVDDVLEWEKVNGIIPEGAFVAFRTDWAKIHPDSLDNKDADGNAHYPGWDLETIKWLVEKRNIGSIGHETSDTDPAVRVAAGNNFAGEAYILQQDKIQMELLCNLDQLPPTGAVIFCVFPKLKGGTGYPTRAFAIAPLD